MSLFVPYRRATLLIPSGPAHNPNQKHLFILLTNPVSNAAGGQDVLLVGVSSVRPGQPHDQTCLLYSGDHASIIHESYVSYRLARIEDAQKLVNGVKQGILTARDMLDGAIFARVCHGLAVSRHTAPKILTFYQEATA
ncbi:MAG: hypothetical protein HY066_12100 [Betaproteobacteria bacterium]|nr:hypothetical protein [Betaproteobacteria bacterium]